MRQQPSAVRASGPILSSVQLRAIAPNRLNRPYVARNPVIPQYPAGVMIEPQVSVPIAKGTSPAPTAAPEPLDEPPAQRCGFQGFRPGPENVALACRYPKPPAISIIANFAANTAPASRSRSITAASKSKCCSLNGGAPHVVGQPFVTSKSFAPYGIPCNAPRSRPAWSSSSAC